MNTLEQALDKAREMRLQGKTWYDIADLWRKHEIKNSKGNYYTFSSICLMTIRKWPEIQTHEFNKKARHNNLNEQELIENLGSIERRHKFTRRYPLYRVEALLRAELVILDPHDNLYWLTEKGTALYHALAAQDDTHREAIFIEKLKKLMDQYNATS
jgi:hypothetical protein